MHTFFDNYNMTTKSSLRLHLLKTLSNLQIYIFSILYANNKLQTVKMPIQI